jgi:hypothetical protein
MSGYMNGISNSKNNRIDWMEVRGRTENYAKQCVENLKQPGNEITLLFKQKIANDLTVYSHQATYVPSDALPLGTSTVLERIKAIFRNGTHGKLIITPLYYQESEGFEPRTISGYSLRLIQSREAKTNS